MSGRDPYDPSYRPRPDGGPFGAMRRPHGDSDAPTSDAQAASVGGDDPARAPVGLETDTAIGNGGDAPALEKRSVRNKKGSFFKELPVLVLIAFVLAVVIKTFLMQAFYIPSESMLPTLEIRDRVLVNKIVYKIREPRRGEIVVFIAERGEDRSLGQRIRALFTEGFGGAAPAERDYIKRVIGLPGETVEVTGEGVFITPPNGKRTKLEEPYVLDAQDMGESQPKLVLGPDEYFVMGDNRANSADSRVRGAVKRSDIVGKAFVRIFPPKRMKRFEVPSYAGLPASAAVGVPGPSSAGGGILGAWSPTDGTSVASGMPGSGWSQGWTRRDAAPSPARCSPVPSSCRRTPTSPA